MTIKADIKTMVAIFIIFIILVVPTGTMDDLLGATLEMSSMPKDTKILLLLGLAIAIYYWGKKK